MSVSLEKEIFGDSDDDFDSEDNEFSLPAADLTRSEENNDTEAAVHQDAVYDEYADRDIPLPSFKRKDDLSNSEPKPAKKKKQVLKRQTEQEDVDPISTEAPLSLDSIKRREARDDVDAVMRKIKPKRNKRDLQDEAEIDEFMDAMLNKMKEAASNDQEFNKNKQPAIAKLKLLPSVLDLLSRITWYSQFLENNILEGIKLWLEPLTDGSLPSLDIQKGMMETLSKMPIETHHLRHSLVGRIVMFYTKCDRVTPSIRRIANDLIRRWMRPILKRSANYKDQELQEVRINSLETRPFKKQRPQASESPSSQSIMSSVRARIPMPVAPSFTVIPVSNVPQIGNGEKRVDKYRKLKSTMKMIKSRNAK
ncbi:hypothetical protein BDV3_003852 [Batrachochytrium dendrobatidis]|nr:Transcription factor iws1 [Batrachochytrium dendrobatidis]